VFVHYPGNSSEQVGRLVVEPLQRIMSEIPGIKHVYGVAQRDGGMVTVQFEVGEEMNPSIVKVHDKIQSNLDKIPPGVQMPLVKPKGIDDVPVVNLTLWSREYDDGALRMIALDVLQQLQSVQDAGAGFVVGGREEQIRVEIMPERLSGFGISLDHVANTIRTANAETNAGNVEAGGYDFTVYSGSYLRRAEDIARLVIGTRGLSPVYVRDVARVSQQPEEPKQLVNYYSGAAAEQRVDGLPAVTIAVAKKVGSNGVTVANDLLAKVEDLRGVVIPSNVQVEVTRNYGKTADDKVSSLILKLFIATGFVTILVLLALGLRASIVVTLVIPVVLLITVFAAWIMGYTIDRVSLFALIFAIGILVDDAIVVVENIYRRWLLKGEMNTPTAVDAVREVGNPTILATFTVVAALLPMGFVSGMMGPYMEPIPALGSVAMLFSLFAAFVFTPYFAMRMRPTLAQLHQQEEKEHKQSEYIEKVFRKTLSPMIERRRLGWFFLIGLVVFFFLAVSLIYPFQLVPVKMLPLDNKPEYSVVIDLPEGTAMPETANVAQAIAQKLRAVDEVVAVQTYVGTAKPFDFNGMVRHYYLRDKPWQAEVQVQLLDKSERKRTSHELALEAREMIADIQRPEGTALTVVEMPPGPPVLQSVVAEVYGPDDYSRRKAADVLTDIFRETDSLTDVDNYMQANYEIWRFEVDTEKAVRRGISVDTINRNLKMALGDFKLGDVKTGTRLEPTYIVIQVPLSIRSQITSILDMPISTGDGGTVPLAELGRFVRAAQDPVVYYKDLQRVEYVVADVTGRLAAPIYGMTDAEALIAKDDRLPASLRESGGTMTGPPGSTAQVAFEWTGEWTVTYETFRDMGIAFGAALILIYILVVWEFGNFVVPAIIMAPIPLTLLGIVPGHMIMGALFGGGEFTATSMIGFIALAGIIVRNSILLVDFSMQEIKSGKTVPEAVISACKARTRPILITAFALVAGSSVILTDPIFQGMAISLLFGVLVSTVLTLLVIPMGCVSATQSLHALCFPEGEDPDPQPDPGPGSGRGGGSGGAGDSPGLGGRVVATLGMGFYAVRAIFILAFEALKGSVKRFSPKKVEDKQRVEAAPETAQTNKPKSASRPARAAERRASVEDKKAETKPATKKATVKEASAKTRSTQPAKAAKRVAVKSAEKPKAKVAPAPKDEPDYQPRRRLKADAPIETKATEKQSKVSAEASAKAAEEVALEPTAVAKMGAKVGAKGSRRRRGIRLKDRSFNGKA
ncbi:MAG: efflux RND transporter permease subunit, partial [Gammaproteobacteria bacterium]